MASTQLSHSTPTGRRLAEQRNLRDPDTLLSKECLLSMKDNDADMYKAELSFACSTEWKRRKRECRNDFKRIVRVTVSPDTDNV